MGKTINETVAEATKHGGEQQVPEAVIAAARRAEEKMNKPPARQHQPLNWKKTPGLNEWKADGYYIEQTDEQGHMLAHARTAEGFVADKVGAFTAGDGETDRQLLKRVKTACEQHRRGQREPEPKAAKLSVAGALDWQETEPGSGIWEATTDDGGSYTCTEIGRHWRAGYSFMGLVPLWPERVTLEGAQLLCEQHHAGRGLEWREGVGCWLADDNGERDYYACELDEDGEQWTATDQSTDTEIGHVASLNEAQARCQIHRGKRLLLKTAKAALPETAKLLLGTLDWIRGDQRWTAETGQRHTEDDGEDLGPVVYAVEPDSDGQWWSQLYTDPVQALGPPAASLEAAQALCQQHHDTTLRWREANPGLWVATSAALHPSEDYSCLTGIVNWSPRHLEDPIGEPTTLERAKQACQEHHRELVMGGAQQDEPVAPGELGEWSIPVQLTEQQLAKRGQRLGEITVQLGQQTLRIAQAKEAAKKAVKAAEAEIEELNGLALPLAESLEAGEEYQLVRCRRHTGNGELYYTDPDTGDELHRHAVVKGEQQGLWGSAPPPDKPPEAAPDSVPFAVADRLDGDGPNETPLERTDGSEPPASVLDKVLDRAVAKAPPLEWSQFRIVGEKGGKGEPAYHAAVPGGEYRVERGESTRLLQAFWRPAEGKPVELPGEHATKKAAQAEAEQHWQSRLLWPGDSECGVLVDATNRYQLMRDNKGDWMAIYVGKLGEKAKELGGGDIDEAKEACQDHFDAGRWTT